MVKFLSQEMDDRFRQQFGLSANKREKRNRTIIDLALDEYIKERIGDDRIDENMDSTFKTAAMCQIRTFLFAGHDTSSSTLCYCYHLLGLHPAVRDILIGEHNEVLGPNPEQAPKLLSDRPHLLNQLPYTLAVIKETLRLYPPASSLRQGEPDFNLTTSQGLKCPTDGFLVWSNHRAIHRNPKSWKRSEDFIPQRWLTDEDDELFNPDKGSWRSFEYGPRSCIGQELAMLEIKLTLVLTCRKFQIESAYEEFDATRTPKGPIAVNGDKAYQILAGAAHPRDGFPCKVSIRPL